MKLASLAASPWVRRRVPLLIITLAALNYFVRNLILNFKAEVFYTSVILLSVALILIAARQLYLFIKQNPEDVFPGDRRNKTALYLLVLIVFASTFFARYQLLDSHFAHVDDIGIAQEIIVNKNLADSLKPGSSFKNALKKYVLTTDMMSYTWTYAPYQFLITYFFVQEEDSYRRILFKGRLPSFIFALLTFGVLLLIGRLLNPETSLLYSLPALTIFSFAWMSIIYSVQMEHYAIGLFAASSLTLLLLFNLRRSEFSLPMAFFSAAAAALLSAMQYQILLIVPGFYGIMLLHFFRSTDNIRQRLTGTGKLILSGLLFGLFSAPVYLRYLMMKTSDGVHWNAGLKHEFLFSPNTALGPNAGFIELTIYTLKFYTLNFFTSFGAVINPIMEDNVLYLPLQITLLLLFIGGLYLLLRSNKSIKKLTGYFILLSFVIWFCLIAMGKLTLSPTRHSLVYGAFFILPIAEALLWLALLPGKGKYPGRISAGLTGMVGAYILLFFFSYGEISARRQDPFQEAKIAALLEKHKVTFLVDLDFTRNLQLMHLGNQNRAFYSIAAGRVYKVSDPPVRDFTTVCIVSHRTPLNSAVFARIKKTLHFGPSFKYEFSDYTSIYREHRSSPIQISPSQRTDNAGNNYFFEILRLKPENRTD